MFSLAQSFTHLAVRRDQILTLLHSLNAVAVKVPGLPVSPALGYVAGWESGPGTASVVIYLHYPSRRRAVAYLHEPRAFPLAELPAAVDRAIDFLESMGFMLDDSAFGTLTAAQQQEVVARTPLFFADLAGFAARAEPEDELPEIEAETLDDDGAPAATAHSERAEAIGRVLMSF